MCYNCGCGMPKDDMGKGALHKGGASLVEEDFEHMAKVWGMSIEDTKKEIFKMLRQQVEKKMSTEEGTQNG